MFNAQACSAQPEAIEKLPLCTVLRRAVRSLKQLLGFIVASVAQIAQSYSLSGCKIHPPRG